MLSLFKPSRARIQRFLARRQQDPYTYSEVGATLGVPPAGYVVDHNRVGLGEGKAVFDRACAALRSWAMVRVGWVEVCWPETPIDVGVVVGVLGRGFGVWSLFACRIVHRIEEHGRWERFGFAYGTLPGHLLSGEE